MIDIAYVPTMCNHCDDAPCMKADKAGAISKRDDGIVIIDPVKAKGQQGAGRRLPLRPHLVERGIEAAAGLAVRRPSARPGLAADPRPAVVSDRRHARDQGRGRRDGAHGARGGARGDEARARHQAARLLSQPLALHQVLHRRQRVGGGERRGRLRRGRDACASCKDGADGRHRHHRQLRRLQVRQARRGLRPLHRRRSPARAAQNRSKPTSAPASTWAKSGCSAGHLRTAGTPRTRLAPDRNPNYPCIERAAGVGRPATTFRRGNAMAWTTPTLVEICIGLEINGYLPAEF